MVSLASVRRLQAFSDRRQDECERGLDKAVRALAPLERELQQIEQQSLGLSELLISQRPQNQRLSHAQLLALLRRQAVIRRQIGNLALNASAWWSSTRRWLKRSSACKGVARRCRGSI